MVCFKYSNSTKYPHPRCHVVVKDIKNIKNITNAAARTVEETRNSLNEYEAMIKTVEGIRWSIPATAVDMKEEESKKPGSLPIQPIFPVLCDFPFIGATNYRTSYIRKVIHDDQDETISEALLGSGSSIFIAMYSNRLLSKKVLMLRQFHKRLTGFPAKSQPAIFLCNKNIGDLL